jgi:hypothetical protein
MFDELPRCHRPLIEIDHYGERRIGCIKCNRGAGYGNCLDDLEAITSRARSL